MSRFKKTGRLAPVALMSAIGLVIPAAAVAHGMTSHAGVSYTANGGCEHRRGALDGDHDKDKCKTPKPTPTKKAGCFDIDSTVHGSTKYVSVVCNGQVFILGVAEESGTSVPLVPPGWQSVGGPADVIDATVTEFDNRVIVTALTASGTVFEGQCQAGPGAPGPGRPIIVPCAFTQLPTPPNNT
jgi:hypothetical protein